MKIKTKNEIIFTVSYWCDVKSAIERKEWLGRERREGGRREEREASGGKEIDRDKDSKKSSKIKDREREEKKKK